MNNIVNPNENNRLSYAFSCKNKGFTFFINLHIQNISLFQYRLVHKVDYGSIRYFNSAMN